MIDEIEVEFGRGLNILTGETGAGKSIILGSVNLALGGRYTKDILRQGTRYGLVELTFSVESERQIRRLKELDVYPEDGFVTLQRRLMEGRSVSKINGETVQMATLKAVSAILIDTRNEADSMVFQTEKAMEEVGDKIDANDKAAVEADLNALKEAINKAPAEQMTDAQVEEIKAAKEKLMNSAQKLFAKVYEQAQAAQGAAGAQGQAGPQAGQSASQAGYGDDVVDGDYKEV